MPNISYIVSAVISTTVASQRQFGLRRILQSFQSSRMHQSPIRKRTSARLMQREDIRNNDSISLNNLQAKINKPKEIAEHTKNVTGRKRKSNTKSVQDESKVDIHKVINGSKRSKAGVSKISENDQQQKSIKGETIQNRRPRNHSDNQSKSSSKSSKQDPSSTQCGQTPNDQELLIKYNKRLDDLKKNSVFSTTPIFESLCTRYERLRNDSKAAAMSKYMRNKFEYFGIPTPQRKAACADLWKDVKKLNSSDLRTLAHQTWFSPEREFHYFTVELLEKEMLRIYDDHGMSTKDLALKTLDFVKVFIEHTSSWWDTVDALSANVVGRLVQKYPSELLPEMDKWNISSCFWLCRTSILYQLSYKNNTDADRLFRYCLKVADEDEFFIRKAIGWALRQYYRTDPKAVRNFVLKHKDKLSPLSVKEALKHDK